MKNLIFVGFMFLFTGPSYAFTSNDNYFCEEPCSQGYECLPGWGPNGPNYQCRIVRNRKPNHLCDWDDLSCPEGYRCNAFWGPGPFQCVPK
ncbi:MAG: hypothetical protein KDD50_07165 [Bdellovibrionales bacterium]|nr:hypothetical protein [Bdellovibrionales bacterium]